MTFISAHVFFTQFNGSVGGAGVVKLGPWLFDPGGVVCGSDSNVQVFGLGYWRLFIGGRIECTQKGAAHHATGCSVGTIVLLQLRKQVSEGVVSYRGAGGCLYEKCFDFLLPKGF